MNMQKIHCIITPHRPVTKQNLPLTQYSAFNSIVRLSSLSFSPIFVLSKLKQDNMNIRFGALTLITLLGLGGSARAQSGKSIGLYYSFPAHSSVVTFEQLVGGGSYESNGMQNFGISYIHGLNRVLDFETGIDYSEHHVIRHPAFLGDATPPPTKVSARLVTVPALLRANLGNYVYLNGGPMIDIDISQSREISNQTGLGVALGAGGRYAFKSGISVFVNPNARLHALSSFTMQRSRYRIIETGIRVGLAYAIAK